jgi:hypothetical protein
MDFSTHDSDSGESESVSDSESMAANEEEDEIETIAMKRAKTFSGLKCSAAGLCVGVGSFSDPEDLQVGTNVNAYYASLNRCDY